MKYDIYMEKMELDEIEKVFWYEKKYKLSSRYLTKYLISK